MPQATRRYEYFDDIVIDSHQNLADRNVLCDRLNGVVCFDVLSVRYICLNFRIVTGYFFVIAEGSQHEIL